MEFLNSQLSSTFSLDELLERYISLSDSQQRAVAAVVGASVADAATRPFHWLYDSNKLKEIVGDSDPEFWPQNECPFYSMVTGERSCVSDESIAALCALSPNANVEASIGDVATKMTELFSEESDYAKSLAVRRAQTTRASVPGPWLQKTVITFLERHAAGNPVTGEEESNELDGFCVSLPFTARFAVLVDNDEDAAAAIIPTSAMLSAKASAQEHAAVCCATLRSIIRTGDFFSALTTAAAQYPDITAELSAVTDAIQAGEDCTAALAKFGIACNMPGSFQGAIFVALSTTSFVEAIRKNILAGGSNCSRANLIGALLGAKGGIGGDVGVPVDWITRTSGGLQIFALALSRVACVSLG